MVERSVTSTHPARVRIAGHYPTVRWGVLEDPGDEKSWYRSQRYEDLTAFYGNRDPAWYARVVAPLRSARRALDLGCGPALALRAMREAGVTEAVGVDRWPGFADLAAQHGLRVLLHDLTLPMPFLVSCSFDAVFSHFVLDYLSPAGVRQVLREAQRLLEPGGQLLFYVGASGLSGADETRTVPYGPRIMEILGAEAGFEEIAATPVDDGRNVILRGRRGDGPSRGERSTLAADVPTRAEVQLSGAFAAPSSPLAIVLEGDGAVDRIGIVHRAAVGDPLAAAIRVSAPLEGATRVDWWVWQGEVLVAADNVWTSRRPVRLVLEGAGTLEHCVAWQPVALALEPAGSAYASLSDLDTEVPDLRRRLVVVERAGESIDPWVAMRRRHDRFCVLRGGARGAGELEATWQAGRLHGLAAAAERLGRADVLAEVAWAAARQVVVYVEAERLDGVLAVVRPVLGMNCSIALVDPSLTGGDPPAPDDVASLASKIPAFAGVHVLLAASTVDRAPETAAALGNRLLVGGSGFDRLPGEIAAIATENLRYLTERAVVCRLRLTSPYGSETVGRRPAFPRP